MREGDALAGRYELSSMVAEAGSHRQWYAVDRTLARDVIVITFPANDEHAEATLDSARRAAGVDDHHLLRVLDVGTQDDTSYVVTERAHDAESVADLLRFQTLPAEEARRIVGEAATGLHTAAARGLHHLALTPHDLLRSRSGAVTVVGVATDGALAGRDDVPAAVASRSDTVALVRILYTALTGHWPGPETVPGVPDLASPTGGTGDGSTASNGDRIPRPAALVTRVPSDLDAVCDDVLNDDAGPVTPGELARVLSPWSSERVHGVGGKDAAAADARERAQDVDRPTGAGARYFEDTAAPAHRAHPVRRPDPDETHQHAAAVPLAPAPPAAADPDLIELGPPAPGLRAGTDEPDRRSSGLALGIVAVLLILTLVVAVYGLRGIGRGPAAASTPSASRTTSAPTTSSISRAPTGVALKPTRASGFDPQGDGDEHNELARRAIDGDTGTAWLTHLYRDASFGGTKKGTGLLLDLGSSKQVSSVSIDVAGNPTTLQVFVGDTRSVSGTPFGTLTNGSGEQTIRGTAAARGRYVIVWITRLSSYSSTRFRDQIAEVKAFS